MYIQMYLLPSVNLLTRADQLIQHKLWNIFIASADIISYHPFSLD